MADIEKKIISAPELPNVVQGDGRYVMSQIRRYLKEVAIQVNLANGYTADEISPSPSGAAAPANFVLQFDTSGGHFSWRHVTYLDKLFYYELRTDADVGNSVGLLERTQETSSDVMPESSAGQVYLYAVMAGGTYSDASVLSYNKKRPEAPQDISMTKNEQGILITYTYVPLDCIGAHVYVDGIMYETDDNLFLYTGGAETVDKVEVAYYDSFGEGERGVLYIDIPDVTNFIVERNGSMLDFQWDAVEMHGAGYVVKASSVPVWENGREIFRTNLTKKKLEYPNAGELYFMIKAYDEHGNYSDEASWYLITTVEDSSRNVILTFDQYDSRYDGNKINMYYDEDAGGLRLTEDAFTGEYIAKGVLPMAYRARNWYEGEVSSIENANLTVNDLDFSLIDDMAGLVTCLGGIIGDADGVELRAQISRYLGGDAETLFLARMNGTTDDEEGNLAIEAQDAETYAFARWDKGLEVSDMTRLAYQIADGREAFHLYFSVKKTAALSRCVFAVLKCGDGWLEAGWDGAFYLTGSDGVRIAVEEDISLPDYITFGISQGAEERAFYLKHINTLPGSVESGERVLAGYADTPPIGAFNTLYFYKGETT